VPPATSQPHVKVVKFTPGKTCSKTPQFCTENSRIRQESHAFSQLFHSKRNWSVQKTKKDTRATSPVEPTLRLRLPQQEEITGLPTKADDNPADTSARTRPETKATFMARLAT
jgi:hypothetical protein